MKTFRFIFISYLKRDFDTMIASVLAPFFLAASVIGSLTSGRSATLDETQGPIFLTLLMAMGYATFVVGYGIRHILETGAGHLYPRFRSRHLTAAALFLMPYLIVPVIVFVMCGLPVLGSTAMLILMCVLAGWTTLLFGNSLLSALGMLIALRTSYEVLGLSERPLIVAPFNEFLAPFQAVQIPFLFIAACLVAIAAFARYVLISEGLREKQSPYPYAGLFPVPINTPTDLTTWRLKRRLEKINRHPAPRSLSSLLQISLFSPDYSFPSLFLRRTFPVYVGITFALTVILVFVSRLFVSAHEPTLGATAATTTFAMYQFMAMALSTDFLIHRHQLPSLWLRSQSLSRGLFMRSVVRTYLGVAGWVFLCPTTALVLSAAFLPTFTVEMAFGVAAMGFGAMLMVVALSLLVVPAVKSDNCAGWVIPNMFALVILMQVLWLNDFFVRTETVRMAAGVVTAFAATLLCTAAAMLPQTELDFRGKESS